MVEEIRNNFSRGYFGKAMRVRKLGDNYPAWTLKDSKWVGIAVPMNQYTPCNEEFANVQLMSVDDFDVDGIRGPFLILRSFDQNTRNEFAVVCAQFAEPGANGELRDELMTYPANWWRRWRDLLGNSATDHKPYSVLGELLLVEILMHRGENPKWSGAGYGTHDIESDSGSIEVKSTTDRHGSEITISSVHQLSPTKEKPLKLAFVRFEPAPKGTSIDEVVGRLIAAGYDESSLEQNLSQLGFPLGRESRRKPYRLLELNVYDVDEQFPAITLNAFKGSKLPTGIVKLMYTVDLAGLDCESWI